MATIDGVNKKLSVSGEQIEESVGKSHEHSNKTVLDKLSDNNGTLQYNGADITGSGSAYTLPTASETVLGGVKVDGTTITVNPDGIISATSTGGSGETYDDTEIKAEIAKKQDKLTAGTNVTIENGVISASGDIDENILKTAIGDYLTENPPSAMTDEAIATSVNTSIEDGTISIPNNFYPFRDDCINSAPYIIDMKVYGADEGTIKRGIYIKKAMFRNDLNLSQITFAFLDTLEEIGTASKTIFGETAWAERTGVKKYSYTAKNITFEFYIDWNLFNQSLEFNQGTETPTKCILDYRCYQNVNFNRYSTGSMDGKLVTSNYPFEFGSTPLTNGFILDLKVYNDNGTLYKDGIYIQKIDFKSDGYARIFIYDKATQIEVLQFNNSQIPNKAADRTGIQTLSKDTADGVTFELTVDWGALTSLSYSVDQSTFVGNYVFSKQCFINQNFNKIEDKSIIQSKIENNYPFELGSYKNIGNSILSLNIYTDNLSILTNGVYLASFVNSGAFRFILKECNTDNIVVSNVSSERTETIDKITFNYPNSETYIELVIDTTKIKGFEDGTQETARISKSVIQKKSKFIKEKLKVQNFLYPNTVYTILNDNPTDNNKVRHAVPLYLDYGYTCGGWTAIKNGYEQDYKVLYADGRDNKLFYSRASQDTTIKNTKKKVDFISDKYEVDSRVINQVSLSKKAPNQPLRVLTIGDSVTAGAITKAQYWFKVAEYFAQEDIDMNRNSQVMMLGSNNYRNQEITYKETTKNIFASACGISSWSLNSWLTIVSDTTDYSNPSGLNGFTYVDDEGVTQFSILKWIERFRNYDDEGNKLAISDENIGSWIAEANIDKVQCCTPNVIYINSTHNGGTIEEHEKIMNVIKTELPDCKIIIGSPMPLLGSSNRNAYADEWLMEEIECPYYGWQQGGNQLKYAKYWLKYENEHQDENFYYFPQSWMTPTVDALEYDEYTIPGLNKTVKGLTTQPMPKEHPGTATHDLWGYGLYTLLKYISIRMTEGYTTNEKEITLDKTSTSITVGETDTLTATTSDTTDCWYGVYWSSDESVATVDKTTGIVTGVGAGECDIYAINGTCIYPAVCKVTVTE